MRHEQFEIWVLRGKRWEMSSSFMDFELASAIANTYKERMRLIHAVYQNGARVQEDILAEMGMTREKP
jgi:acetyl-CoA carboxylase beta subunit